MVKCNHSEPKVALTEEKLVRNIAEGYLLNKGEGIMTTEISKKEISLLGLFGEEKLNELQERVSAVTDFSIEMIDYRGISVSKSLILNEFCKIRGKNCEVCGECRTKAAFAAAKAAIQNQPYIFLCDGGLAHIALPIIVNNQYLGAMLVGKVKCPELNQQEKQGVDQALEQNAFYSTIPMVSLEKINAVSKMMSFFLKEMVEKENNALTVSALEHKEKHLKDLRRKNKELLEQIRQLNAQKMRARVLPEFQLSMMIAMSSFAILEEAEKTEEMIVRSTEILRYYIDSTKEQIILQNEINQIENYLKILKAQYEGQFKFHLQCDEKSGKIRIPILSIFPFVEYMVDYGLFSNSFNGTLYLDCDAHEEQCVIQMQLESGRNRKQGERREQIQSYIQNTAVADQLNQAEKRLQFMFDDQCEFTIQKELIRIVIPWKEEV